ncbi:Rho protein GDP-dissociation inhibitor [Dillenia turbinata]|uniref:Rho protein GDP-dissociation inhibitor n=1 Tax=Dillenia turbinata TaxID=194707 RepID=A0AAN8UX61_9MAGN
MSLAVEAVSSCSKNMAFDEKTKAGEETNEVLEKELKAKEKKQENCDESGKKFGRQMSETEEGEEEDDDEEGLNIQVGPQFSLKEQLEKDKDDESLRRWKEQLLGSVDFGNIGVTMWISVSVEQLLLFLDMIGVKMCSYLFDDGNVTSSVECLEPDVKILSLSIVSAGRPDIILLIPEAGNPKGLWFTLKEGSKYSLKFSFLVKNNIVSGLKYTNSVWKTGIKVDSTKEMLGTFSPRSEAYAHMMPEETTPLGIFARGSYSARSKFLDDDNKCYLEINYTFDIRKEWASPQK